MGEEGRCESLSSLSAGRLPRANEEEKATGGNLASKYRVNETRKKRSTSDDLETSSIVYFITHSHFTLLRSRSHVQENARDLFYYRWSVCKRRNKSSDAPVCYDGGAVLLSQHRWRRAELDEGRLRTGKTVGVRVGVNGTGGTTHH